jgi:hypothetical protein
MKPTLTLLTALLLAPLAVSQAAETTMRVASQKPIPVADAEAVWAAIDDSFRAPPNAFRVVQYGGHEGAVAPVDKMRASGIGGVMLFLGKHGYLRNETAWSNMLASIRLAKEAVAGQRIVSTAAARSEQGATFPASFRLRVEGVPKGLFVGRYTRQGRRMTYLVNSNATPMDSAVSSEAGAEATVRVYNPVDGTIREHKLPFTLTIEGYAGRFLVE